MKINKHDLLQIYKYVIIKLIEVTEPSTFYVMLTVLLSKEPIKPLIFSNAQMYRTNKGSI